MSIQLGRLDDTLKIASIWLNLWNLVVMTEGLSQIAPAGIPLHPTSLPLVPETWLTCVLQ